jgi:hypothetical protein
MLAGKIGDHGGEGADLAGCGVQFGAAVQDGLELGALVLGEVVGAAAEPVGDVPDGRRGLAERCLLRAGAVEVAADDGVAAVVAEGLDLVEQAGEAAVAAVGVPVQVGLERVELAGSLCRPAALGEFLPGGGAVVALDGVQSPAKVAGDLPQPAPFGAQRVDQLVLAPGALGEPPGRVRARGIRRGRGIVFRSGEDGLGQAGAVGGDALLDGLGEVLPQVEAVGDLDRVRCPGPGAVGVRPRAVPCR